MHIALMWPDYWPYIRRGTERMTHDIARFLTSRGHTVDILTTKPGAPRIVREGPLRIIYQRQISHPLLIKLRAVPRFDFYGLTCLRPLLAERYDLIHLMFYSAGPAVRLLERLRGTPYIYHVQMIPPHWGRPGDAQLFRLTLRGAAEVRSLSKYCDDALLAEYGRSGMVIPPTTDCSAFQIGTRTQPPRILFTADLKAPSKGAGLLALAFNHLYRRRPDAILQFAGPTHPLVDQALLEMIEPEARRNVQMLGPGTLATLRELYTQASVLVLPSQGEPFGLVLTEALASGTPVVGTRSGGIPEIISNPQIGRLFDLDPVDPLASARNLAAAIEGALDLAADPATPQHCRNHAAQWDWPALGPLFVELQERALARGKHGSYPQMNAD